MKCEICKKQISETFLKKIVGTQVKDKTGKLHPICPDCQKRLKTKQEILGSL